MAVAQYGAMQEFFLLMSIHQFAKVVPRRKDEKLGGLEFRLGH